MDDCRKKYEQIAYYDDSFEYIRQQLPTLTRQLSEISHSHKGSANDVALVLYNDSRIIVVYKNKIKTITVLLSPGEMSPLEIHSGVEFTSKINISAIPMNADFYKKILEMTPSYRTMINPLEIYEPDRSDAQIEEIKKLIFEYIYILPYMPPNFNKKLTYKDIRSLPPYHIRPSHDYYL